MNCLDFPHLHLQYGGGITQVNSLYGPSWSEDWPSFSRLQMCPLYIFDLDIHFCGNYPPQMVPKTSKYWWNQGFGLAWFRARSTIYVPLFCDDSNPQDTIEKNSPMHSFIRTDRAVLFVGRFKRSNCVVEWMPIGNGWRGRLKEWNSQKNWMLTYMWWNKCEKGYAKWNDVDMILIHYQSFMWT